MKTLFLVITLSFLSGIGYTQIDIKLLPGTWCLIAIGNDPETPNLYAPEELMEIGEDFGNAQLHFTKDNFVCFIEEEETLSDAIEYKEKYVYDANQNTIVIDGDESAFAKIIKLTETEFVLLVKDEEDSFTMSFKKCD